LARMHRDWQERRKIGLDDAIDLADSRMALEIRHVYRLPRATLSPGVAGARSLGQSWDTHCGLV
jgi:hypothetical protein